MNIFLTINNFIILFSIYFDHYRTIITTSINPFGTENLFFSTKFKLSVLHIGTAKNRHRAFLMYLSHLSQSERKIIFGLEAKEF